jgi:hypothetical protein
MKAARLFTQHPASVGETYFQHARAAGAFGLRMLVGGTACLIHAVFPFLFIRTGGDCVADLHSRIVVRRGNTSGSTKDVDLARALK